MTWRAADERRRWFAAWSARASTATSDRSRRPAKETDGELLDLRRSDDGGKRLDVHRLNVGELANPERRAFAAVAGVLDPAERRARVGADILVDEARPGLELLRGDSPAAREITGKDPRTEPELALIGDPDRVRFVIGGDDRGHRPEHFLIVRRLAGQHVGEHGCWVPGAGPVGHLAAEQRPGALADAFGDLGVDMVARLDALH